MVVFNWPKGHQTTNEKFNPDNKILMLIVNSFFFCDNGCQTVVCYSHFTCVLIVHKLWVV